jgi:hypothetical protein
MKTFVEWLSDHERRQAEFKVLFGVSMDDFMTFFKATGRIPRAEEIVIINRFGVGVMLRAVHKSIKIPDTLYSDLEKLHSAKRTFVEACKQTFEKWFKIKTHGKF